MCIVVFPNAAVGVLAGTSRMDPARFISLTVVSVLARLVLFRFLGQLAGSLVDAILQKVRRLEFATRELCNFAYVCFVVDRSLGAPLPGINNGGQLIRVWDDNWMEACLVRVP